MPIQLPHSQYWFLDKAEHLKYPHFAGACYAVAKIGANEIKQINTKPDLPKTLKTSELEWIRGVTSPHEPINKEWIFINANSLPVKYLETTNEIANNVLRGLSHNEYTTFTTKIYVNNADKLLLSKAISAWKKLESWQNLHKVTEEKAQCYIDSKNASWLHTATEVGDRVRVKALLVAKTNPYRLTQAGASALHNAAFNGHPAIIKMLLNAKVDINLKDSNGFTALYMASLSGNSKVISLLLKAKANTHLTTKVNGLTPLLIAAYYGCDNAVKLLINKKRTLADINVQAEHGDTPLHIAAQRGHLKIVELLLKANANVNLVRKDQHLTPLYLAVNQGFLPIVEALLRFNADPNIPFKQGITPLYCAVDHAKVNIVNALLNANADPNLQTEDGVTPLFIAAQKNLSDIVELLIAKNANTSLAFKTTAKSLMQFASSHNVTKTMQNFINGKDPNNIAMTPKDIANVMENHEIAALLSEVTHQLSI